MHAMGDVIDMRRFRGLRHRLPITFGTFAVGGLALAAIPPLSGFFSKDEILGALSGAVHSSHEYGYSWIYLSIYWLAIATAFLTAFYTGRAFFMTFFGPEKLPSPDDPEANPAAEADAHAHGLSPHAEEHHVEAHHHEIGHESPPIMAIPLMILAGCTVLIGLICLVAPIFTGGTVEWFAGHLHKTLAFESLGHGEHGFSWPTAIIGTLVGVGGIGLAYVMYAGTSRWPQRLRDRLRPLYEASLHKFYIDEIYQAVVVGPLRALTVISDFVDTYIVDRLVTGIALAPRAFARARLALYQNGLIQFYAAASAMSVAVLLLVLLLLGSQ
jgi:NADH-quinone oxidoreductase subunit L